MKEGLNQELRREILLELNAVKANVRAGFSNDSKSIIVVDASLIDNLERLKKRKEISNPLEEHVDRLNRSVSPSVVSSSSKLSS